MKSTFLPLYLYIIGFYACNTFGASCRHGDYLSTAGECCPMCNIGLVVFSDCVGDYSTTCIPCTKGTFMNVPNGVNTCKTCKTCGRGLYILQNCSTIKDTVCEVLDGYYCAQHSYGECSLAMKHSECKPGEQIKTPGTRVSDAVCETCLPGFYSLEGVRCIKWTDCSLNNEIVDEEGTSITDVKCKPTRRRSGLIAAFVLIAALLTTAVSLLSLLLLNWRLIRHRRNRNNRKLGQGDLYSFPQRKQILVIQVHHHPVKWKKNKKQIHQQQKLNCNDEPLFLLSAHQKAPSLAYPAPKTPWHRCPRTGE